MRLVNKTAPMKGNLRPVTFHFAWIILLSWFLCELEKDNWKKFEKNNIIIALNVLYAKNEKIYPAYVSKHNSKREKQVTLLMISNGSKRKSKSEWCEAKSEGQWQLHYLAIKKLSALL